MFSNFFIFTLNICLLWCNIFHNNEIYNSEIEEKNKMTISERILKVLKDRNMTQVEFAKQVGIATSTISEWKKRKTNPVIDALLLLPDKQI